MDVTTESGVRQAQCLSDFSSLLHKIRQCRTYTKLPRVLRFSFVRGSAVPNEVQFGAAAPSSIISFEGIVIDRALTIDRRSWWFRADLALQNKARSLTRKLSSFIPLAAIEIGRQPGRVSRQSS